jgi:NhaP-type Na+/H+ or K+/H+ antiporter
MGQNVHLFTISIFQLCNFAFPMVLAGTVLTALVGYYIFPYGWSFNLAMTFGSILSATDPVAVAALLEEVGKKETSKIRDKDIS